MKKAALLLAILLRGCVGPLDIYTPYVGVQQDWRIEDHAFVQQFGSLAVYPKDQFPSRPYDMIGQVKTDSQNVLIADARKYGADAAIVAGSRTLTSFYQVPSSYTATVAGDTAVLSGHAAYTESVSMTVTGYYLIRFSDQAKLRSQIHLYDQFLEWAEENKNGFVSADGTTHYTAEQIASRRSEVEQKRAALMQLSGRGTR